MPIACKIPFTGLTRQYNSIREETLECVDSVLSSGQLMNGAYTQRFEQWLAVRNHVKYAVTCHSGSQALEIIAEYTRKRILTDYTPIALIPTMTYVATANAFVRAGWDVHLVDVDCYGILDTKKINHAYHYDVVVPIGLYGAALSRSEAAWWAWSTKNGIIIEDAAQHWLSNNSQRVGVGSAVSFDPTKNLANFGNGGAVLTNDANLAFYAQGWRSNGQKGNSIAGSNSRMSEIDSATMLIKTSYIDQWQLRRNEIAKYWIDKLDNSDVRCLIDDTNFDQHCFHKFIIEVDYRNKLATLLAQDRIETKIHYASPLHESSQYYQYPGPGFMSTASALSRRVLSLPIYPELSDIEVEYIIDRVLMHVDQMHS